MEEAVAKERKIFEQEIAQLKRQHSEALDKT